MWVLSVRPDHAAVSLLKDYPDPTDEQIDGVMGGSLCRCMTYVRIRKAIKKAAAAMQKEEASHG